MVCPFGSCTTSGREPVGDLGRQFELSWIISSLYFIIASPRQPHGAEAQILVSEFGLILPFLFNPWVHAGQPKPHGWQSPEVCCPPERREKHIQTLLPGAGALQSCCIPSLGSPKRSSRQRGGLGSSPCLLLASQPLSHICWAPTAGLSSPLTLLTLTAQEKTSSRSLCSER